MSLANWQYGSRDGRLQRKRERLEPALTDADYDWPSAAEVRADDIDEQLLDMARYPDGWCGDGICNCAEGA